MTTLIGYPTIGDYDYGNFNGNGYCRFQALESGTLDSILCYIMDAKGTYMRLGIYSDNAGVIEHILAQAVVSSLSTYTWNSVTGLSVELTKDTYYWLAVNFDGISRRNLSGATVYNLTSTGSTAFIDDPHSHYYATHIVSIYGTGTVSASIDVAAVTMAATAEAPAPAVTCTTNATVSAVTATGSADAAVPAVTAQSSITISGVPATASAAAVAPSIALYSDSEVQTIAIDAKAETPTVSGSALVSAETSTASADQATPSLIVHSIIAPSPMSAAAVFPTPTLMAGSDPFAGSHPILSAAYFVEAPDVNRSFVVGTTAAGAEVSGSAITQADVDLVGERLSAHHNPAIPSATVAAAVAIAPLSLSRLDSMRAQVTIPPHCGIELWDVVSVTDDIANQAVNYRVNGYTLEFRAGTYRHTLDLCAP